MKKNLLLCFLSLMSAVLFAATVTVTPADYESVYNSATDGDILLLDAGTYATALNFPAGKTITLQKLPTAASTPILTFSWTTEVLPTEGSSLILDGLEINLSASYLMQLAGDVVIDKLMLKNCIISNVNRCIIRATNAGTIINEVSVENCIIKDCGADGWALFYTREILKNLTMKNSTIYNYGGEGLFLANTNPQTHTFTFNMENNTIYKSGKDGEAYAWCVIATEYASTSTYNISNNIFDMPFTTADTRQTFIVPEGAGSVSCKNNLVNGFPTFSTAPASGWDLANVFESTTTYFKDPANNDFSLDATFPYTGTDGKMLGDQRWWPSQGSYAKNVKQLQVKAYANNGLITIESPDEINYVEIYTINGSKILAMDIAANKAQIDASIYNKGIYILKVTSQNKIAIQKISL